MSAYRLVMYSHDDPERRRNFDNSQWGYNVYKPLPSRPLLYLQVVLTDIAAKKDSLETHDAHHLQYNNILYT